MAAPNHLRHQICDPLDFDWRPGSCAGRTLPIVTNWFHRLFTRVVILVALSLFWMRFVEPTLPLWVADIIALALAVIIIRKG